MDIGTRIRRLRKAQNRTLADVAAVCDFTPSLLSKIETGHCSPPVATLVRIADALGTSVSALLADGTERGTVFTRAAALAGQPAVVTEAGYQYRLLAGARPEKRMQPYLFTAVRGQVKPHRLRHAGEEFIYVLEGEGRYRVGDTTYDVGPGDSLYFNSDDEHDVTPVSERLVYLAVFVGGD